MISLLRLTTTFICLFAFSQSSFAVENDDKNPSVKIIAKVKKFQNRHITLLAGHDGPVHWTKHKEVISSEWCIELSKLTHALVKELDINRNVFDYHGLLACGRISTKGEGYILELYKGIIDGRVDSGESVLGRHIIYFSKEGKITRIGTSIPLKQ